MNKSTLQSGVVKLNNGISGPIPADIVGDADGNAISVVVATISEYMGGAPGIITAPRGLMNPGLVASGGSFQLVSVDDTGATETSDGNEYGYIIFP